MNRNEANAILEQMDKQFMQPFVTHCTRWFEVENPQGESTFIQSIDFDPKDHLPTEPGDSVTITMRVGYGARLSAPGFMDCTEWCVFDTEDEAAIYLAEQYGDDIDLDALEANGPIDFADIAV